MLSHGNKAFRYPNSSANDLCSFWMFLTLVPQNFISLESPKVKLQPLARPCVVILRRYTHRASEASAPFAHVDLVNQGSTRKGRATGSHPADPVSPDFVPSSGITGITDHVQFISCLIGNHLSGSYTVPKKTQ